MSIETAIEWCDSTVNPTMGCDGCELWGATEKTCYAGVLHQRYGATNKGFAPTFDQVTLFPGRMAKAAAWPDLAGTARTRKPWLDGRPRHVFVSDMSDALSKAVTFDYLKREIIDVVTSPKGSRHVWMWLTKQSSRMADFSAWLAERGCVWPMNLWPGTSITRRATLPRVRYLRRAGDEKSTRFLSVEPLLESIALDDLSGLKLVIVGGESGPNARPMRLQWARDIVEQCRAAGTACFVKQLGGNVTDADSDECQRMAGKSMHDPKGGEPTEWAPDLRVRQFPNPAEAR